MVVMLLVRAFAERLEGADENQSTAGNLGLIAAVGIDVLIDGLLIGVGCVAGARVGPCWWSP
ncbi:hypothetical protein DEIPH_ctg019orf0015 [Deinococcus phoenicis]|uniref:Uncharacterized protein n=1 Tax=Deinococcus phoenicis TaxID=1476583 RepID=A0A016QRV3_9DEIO|nr:hypothetical protein DEIPH_ctg019orf0015 [Deinococcus phoenicis]